MNLVVLTYSLLSFTNTYLLFTLYPLWIFLKNRLHLVILLTVQEVQSFPAPNSKFPYLASKGCIMWPSYPKLSSHHSHCDFLSSQPPWLTHAIHSTWSIFLSHHTCPHLQYAPFSLPLSSQVPLPTWNVFLLFLPKMRALLRTSITVESVCFTPLQFETS